MKSHYRLLEALNALIIFCTHSFFKCCERTKFGWLIPDISYIAAVSRVEHIKTFDLIALTKDGGTSIESRGNSNSNLLLVLKHSLSHSYTRFSLSVFC